MRVLEVVDEAREIVTINADHIDAVWKEHGGTASIHLDSGRAIPTCEDYDVVVKILKRLK